MTDEAADFRRQLVDAGLPEPWADALTGALAADFDLPLPGQPARRRDMLVGRYAIRADDMKIIEAASQGVLAAAGAGFLAVPVSGPAALISAATGIVVSVLKLALQIRGKGRTLEPAQAKILAFLKQRRGALPIEIGVGLSAAGVSLTDAEVARQLEILAKIRLNAGEVKALAEKDAEGRWHTSV
jgi:hypothetical protein